MTVVAAVEALVVAEEASATAVVVEEPVEEPAVASAVVEVRLCEPGLPGCLLTYLRRCWQARRSRRSWRRSPWTWRSRWWCWSEGRC